MKEACFGEQHHAGTATSIITIIALVPQLIERPMECTTYM
jgi:hypothetical protein